jgi:hypothetical protein
MRNENTGRNLPDKVDFEDAWVPPGGWLCEGPGDGEACPYHADGIATIHLSEENASAVLEAVPYGLTEYEGRSIFRGGHVKAYVFRRHFHPENSSAPLGLVCCEHCLALRRARAIVAATRAIAR